MSAPALIMTYGRFNPPTQGHDSLFQYMESMREQIDSSLTFVSPTQNKKTDPLYHRQKLTYLREFFPNMPFSNLQIPNLWEVLKWASDCGYKNVILVCGGDRVDKYKSEFSKYIKHAELSKSLNFDSFMVKNSGDRGIFSADMVRNLVRKDNYLEYKKYLPNCTDYIAKKLYADLRKGLEC